MTTECQLPNHHQQPGTDLLHNGEKSYRVSISAVCSTTHDQMSPSPTASHNLSPFINHASPETHHTSLVTHHTSLTIFIRHRHPSYVTCHPSYVTCHPSYVTCHQSPSIRHASPVTRHRPVALGESCVTAVGGFHSFAASSPVPPQRAATVHKRPEPHLLAARHRPAGRTVTVAITEPEYMSKKKTRMFRTDKLEKRNKRFFT